MEMRLFAQLSVILYYDLYIIPPTMILNGENNSTINGTPYEILLSHVLISIIM